MNPDDHAQSKRPAISKMLANSNYFYLFWMKHPKNDKIRLKLCEVALGNASEILWRQLSSNK